LSYGSLGSFIHSRKLNTRENADISCPKNQFLAKESTMQSTVPGQK